MSVIIDPGHGGTDPGAVGNGIVEKAYNLEVSLYQYKRFKELGVPVKITRTTDKTLEPAARTNLVKNSGMKHCISNHVNAGGGEGAEVIKSLSNTTKLPQLIADHLKAAGQNLRRVFDRKGSDGRDYYFMHRMTGSVSTLIVEYGFLDSKGDDVAQLKSSQIKYAEAVVKAYCQYIGHKYTAPGNIVEEIKEAVENVLPKEVIEPSLKYNAKVKTIQMYLNFYLGKNPVDVDGYYGPNTEVAIEKFQRARGITADGIYGPNTKRELEEYYAELIAKSKPKSTTLYKVQIGAYSDRDNAEARLKEAKKHFKDAIITT